MTWLACAACVVVFLGVSGNEGSTSWARLTQWGYYPANAIWNGAYWAYVTSTVVHIDIWHVAFNVYWLWVLGATVERAIGTRLWLAFFVGAAVVSSGLQFLWSDTTGHGASGVVYALFGLMWVSRGRVPEYARAVTSTIIALFAAWLVLCIVTTHMGVWVVGNAAHVGGLVFGLLVGLCFVRRWKPVVPACALGVLFAAAIVPLFWCPWSVTWMGHKAYAALEQGNYQTSIEWFTEVIEREPRNAWAIYNRGCAYHRRGEMALAERDLRRARELNPTIDK